MPGTRPECIIPNTYDNPIVLGLDAIVLVGVLGTSIFYGDFVGILLSYSLLSTSKLFRVWSLRFRVEGLGFIAF